MIYFTSPLHLSSSCPLTHKALIHCLHLPLSLATALADAKLFHPSCVRSCSVVFLHVAFGHPTLHFPSGCHVSTVVQILLSSSFSTTVATTGLEAIIGKTLHILENFWPDCKAIPAYGLMMSICLPVNILVNLG